MNVYNTSVMVIFLFISMLFVYTYTFKKEPDIGIRETLHTNEKIKKDKKIWSYKVVYSKIQEFFYDISNVFNYIGITTTKNILFFELPQWKLISTGVSSYPQYQLTQVNKELIAGSTNFSILYVDEGFNTLYHNLKQNINSDITAIVNNEYNSPNTIYLGTSDGALYLYNVNTKDLKLITTINIGILYLNFDLNNRLFACNGNQLLELVEDNFIARYGSSNLNCFVFTDKYCFIGGKSLSIIPLPFDYSTTPIHNFEDIINVNGMTVLGNNVYVTSTKDKTGYIYEISLI